MFNIEKMLPNSSNENWRHVKSCDTLKDAESWLDIMQDHYSGKYYAYRIVES